MAKFSTDLPSFTVPSQIVLNQRLKSTNYAVRGELATKALELSRTLESSPNSLPFSKIYQCNIGNPQALGQPPISFLRQICALFQCPALAKKAAKNCKVSSLFERDAIERAETFIKASMETPSLDSHAKGLLLVRREIAAFISKRDQCTLPVDPERIFVANGASSAIKATLNVLIRANDRSGVMLPHPQYPLYSASTVLYGATVVPYFLVEETGWSCDWNTLQSAYEKATEKGISPVALVVINPGNPTGNHLTPQDMLTIVDFCANYDLPLLADEVYQENVYERPFMSFRSISSGYLANNPHRSLALFSFHSTSKGLLGECGRRGGYLECFGNVSSQWISQIGEYLTTCDRVSPVSQLAISLLVNPPICGDPSWPLYEAETKAIRKSLERRALRLYNAINALPHMSCNPVQGALYIFVKICFSDRAIEAAFTENRSVDEFWCLELLGETGICVVPGSGFGQWPGTFHFRTTLLPPESELDHFLKLLGDFQIRFEQRFPFY